MFQRVSSWASSPAARIGAAGLAALGLAAAAASRESAGTGVLRVRTGGDGDTTRVVLELDQAASGKLIADGDDGERKVVLAFPKLDVETDLTGKGQGLIKDWAVDEAGGSARLRLTLARDARVERRFLLPPTDDVGVYRYVLDLRAKGAAPPKAAVDLRPVKAASEARLSKPVIVIDAGHGGKDTGAAGKTHKESAVNLAAAHALRERLERGGRYTVVMTRKSDVFVPLQTRVQIARRAEADLFISLHADSGPNAETRGASVYTLSEKGSERVARKVMNKGGFIDMRLPGEDRSVNQILLDLTQRSTRNRSAVFAELLLAKIDGPAVLLRRSHRDAGFVVLLAPDVPAVLLEMGFMTNQQDEAALTDPARRRRLVDAAGDAIDRWFEPVATTETTIAAR